MSRKVVVFDAVTKETSVKEIGDKLADLQREVGGCIQFVDASSEMANRKIDLIVNEEGKLEGLPVSGYISSKDKLVDLLVGNLLFTSYNEDGETIGLTDEQIDYIENLCVDPCDLIYSNKYFPDVVHFEY